MKHFFRALFILLSVIVFLSVTGCSSDKKQPKPLEVTENPNQTPLVTSPEEPILDGGTGTISLSASAMVIEIGENTTLTATYHDASNQPVADAVVNFMLSNTDMGTLSEELGTTDASGVVKVTFTAGETEGQVALTASSGDVSSSSISLTVQDGESLEAPAQIVFDGIDMSLPSTPIKANDEFEVKTTLYGQNGSVMSQVPVTYYLSDSNMGIFDPPTATTNNLGYARTILTTSNEEGDVTLYAESRGMVATIILTLEKVPPASIKFSSVTNNILAVRGSGGIDHTTVTFSVKDEFENPVEQEAVMFTLLGGPKGGEYIGTIDNTPETDVSYTDGDGFADVIVHSGFTAGPLTLKATINVDGSPVSITSSVVSIGGGVPSDEYFDVGADTLNLAGLGILGLETTITAYIADRYGNYNILDGTMVNFSTETGLAAFSSDQPEMQDGLATVTLRTQEEPKDLTPLTWETNLFTYIENTYDVLSKYGVGDASDVFGNPRDGICSVLIYTNGEEQFIDKTGDGIYNTFIDVDGSEKLEPFTDSLNEAFRDHNENGLFDPDELYIDSNGNNQWDPANGIWDANKMIFRNFNILITGPPVVLFEDGVVVGNNSYGTVHIVVCDRNLNPLIPGTKVTFEAANASENYGGLAGLTEYEFLNVGYPISTFDSEYDQLRLIEFRVDVHDLDPDANQARSQYIKVTVNWQGIDYVSGGYVTVN